jgi:hypothetical protein
MGIISSSTGRYNKMGRSVLNSYEVCEKSKCTLLKIVSPGYYAATAKLDEFFDGVEIVNNVRQYKWCYEKSKGQIYATDLTMKLPRQMHYKTARVYLRDYILFLLGHNPHKVEWRRREMSDYQVKPCDLHPREKHF